MKLALALGLLLALLSVDWLLLFGTTADACAYDGRWTCSDTLQTVTFCFSWALLVLFTALLWVGLRRLAGRFGSPV
jgi:hypothetical protein